MFDMLTENEPKPRCHANGVFGVNVSFNHFEELALVTRSTSEIASAGLNFARI